jgi:hypothetical protein
MIRIHQGLFIAALGLAVPAAGAFDAAAAHGLTRAGGAGVAARGFAPPRRVGPAFRPPRWVGPAFRPPRWVGPAHVPGRRIDGLVAPLYGYGLGYGLGYGYAPGYGGVVVVLPPEPASASEPAPPPRVTCKPARATVEVPAEGGGTRKVSFTRCADE